MNFEEFKDYVSKNINTLYKKANSDEKHLLDLMIDVCNESAEKEIKLIDYLKEQINTLKLKGCNYEKTYICGKITAYEDILSKIEKE